MSLNKVEINTSQNVLVGYEPAGVTDRGIAWLIDATIVAVYMLIVLIIARAIIVNNDLNSAETTWAVIIYVILMLPGMLYDFLCEYFFNGQSVGKKAMSIRVVKLDGTQPSVGAYLLRWVLRGIDFMIGPVIATICISLTKNFQRIGDLAAGTTVVKTTSSVSLYQTILYKQEPEHQITFPQVNRLSDRDISIIKEVYQSCKLAKDQESILKLANKIRTQMGLGQIDKTPEEFIVTVLADYTHYEFEA